MRFKNVIKLFNSGNVCVVGMKGRGKDLLFGNVIARKKKPYVSNLDYSKNKLFNKFDSSLFDVKNDWKNLNKGIIYKYVFPFPDKTDVYISDVNLYYPSYDVFDLNKVYKGFINFMALSRQLGNSCVHINSQNLNRAWDKLREQSDIFILCKRCLYIPILNIVIQRIYIYDKMESCINRVKPCKVHVPRGASKVDKQNIQAVLDNFHNTYGDIKNKLLIYKNKSKHDTRAFKELFKNGI